MRNIHCVICCAVTGSLIRGLEVGIIGALCALLSGFAVPAYGLDLVEAVGLARTRDPVYAAARSAWAASHEKLPQARAALLPALSASANTNYNDRDIAFRNGTSAPGRFNTNGYNVALTQSLFRPQNHAQYAQARMLGVQADAQLAAAAQDLTLRVAQAYFDVLLAQDALALAQAQKGAIGQQLAQAKLSFDLGVTVSADVHEAQARHDLIASQEVLARNDLANRRRILNAIIATPAPDMAGLGPQFRIDPPEPNDVRRWVELATARNFQIAVQRLAVDIATEEVDRNRYAHYPTVDAVASYGRSSAGSGILGGVGYDITTATVGIQISVPLYQGGAVNSKQREAAANQQRARDELEAVSRQVEMAVGQAFDGVTSGIAQVEALRAALTSTEKQVHATRIGRDEGVRSSIDLLNAQQQLFQARRDLAQAQYNYLLNRLRLSAAAGGVDEDDLRKVNSLLAGSASAWTPQGPGMAAPTPSEARPPGSPYVSPLSSFTRVRHEPVSALAAMPDASPPPGNAPLQVLTPAPDIAGLRLAPELSPASVEKLKRETGSAASDFASSSARPGR